MGKVTPKKQATQLTFLYIFQVKNMPLSSR